jgi:predicted component of type VI protein secretion system
MEGILVHPGKETAMQRFFDTNRSVFVVAVTVLTLMFSACAVYEPYYYPASQYDRVWESALRAAEDVGVDIFTADRVNGTIVGRKGPADVTIAVLTQADGSIRVQLNVRGPEEADPHLTDRFYQSYQRYMGR